MTVEARLGPPIRLYSRFDNPELRTLIQLPLMQGQLANGMQVLSSVPHRVDGDPVTAGVRSGNSADRFPETLRPPVAS